MNSSNECLKSLPVCGGCETPLRAWGVSQLGYDDRPKNRLKRCVVYAMCTQSSQRIQSLRAEVYYCLYMLCDWQMIGESYSKYFDNWDTGYVWHRLWQLHCCFAPFVHENDLSVLGGLTLRSCACLPPILHWYQIILPDNKNTRMSVVCRMSSHLQ